MLFGVEVSAAAGTAGWMGRGFGCATGACDVVDGAFVEAEGVGGIEAVFERQADEGGADGPVAGVCGGLDRGCQGIAVGGYARDVRGVSGGGVVCADVGPHGRVRVGVSGPAGLGGGGGEGIA